MTSFLGVELLNGATWEAVVSAVTRASGMNCVMGGTAAPFALTYCTTLLRSTELPVVSLPFTYRAALGWPPIRGLVTLNVPLMVESAPA